MFELECAVQQYAWGKLGSESSVAKLIQSNKNVEIDPQKNYAEFWMGTHKSGPSVVKQTKQLLQTLIESNPKVLGDTVHEKFGNTLPFLFKVLSVNQALSIQVHPNKKVAEMLHASRPDLYPDDNHKPEVAIALTKFEALSGFRPLKEIQKNLTDIVEFYTVVGEENALRLLGCDETNYTESLKNCLRALLTRPKEIVEAQLNKLVERTILKDGSETNHLLLSLVKNYPGDVGCFVIYFLNYIPMCPGDAIYLDANVPHAYLKGDCIECMACSDNVVRAGLTPKFKDVDTLCSILDYDCTPPSKRIFSPVKEDEFTLVFKPPVPDFAVAKIEIPKNSAKYTLINRSTASIILAVAGKATISVDQSLASGKVFFVAAGEEIPISNITEDLQIFQAFTNL